MSAREKERQKRRTEYLKPKNTKPSIPSAELEKEKQNLILMCEDCRVSAQFDQNDKILDVGERPKPRTTDDYN